MIDIFLKNIFWGYDLILFISFFVTVIFMFKSRQYVKLLHDKMNPSFYAPNAEKSKNEISSEMAETTIRPILEMRESSTRYYSIFTNLIAIFPLWGILGTVYSLLRLALSDNSITETMDRFYSALTSTFWGILFAIIFKILDSAIIAPLMEENEKDVERFLDRKSLGEKAEK